MRLSLVQIQPPRPTQKENSYKSYIVTKNKSGGFKNQLRKALFEKGWSIVSLDDASAWWNDGCWIIRAERQAFGKELVVTFLVDPIFEGPDEKKPVWSVLASTERPQDRLDTQTRVADMYMQKGRYAEKLEVFVNKLDELRNEQQGK